MTATPPPPAEHPACRRLVTGWWVPAVLLTFAPKCLLCVAGYFAAGTALGLGGREICGAPADSFWSWLTWLPVLGVVIGTAGVLALVRRSMGLPARVCAAAPDHGPGQPGSDGDHSSSENSRHFA